MGEVVAIINVESDRLDAFDDGDVVALDGIASQVASAIRNARLFEDKVRTVRSMEILQEITTVLNSDLDLDAVLGRIARRSVEAVKAAQMGAVLLFDEDHLVVRSSYGYAEAEALAHVRLAFEGLPARVRQRPGPLRALLDRRLRNARGRLPPRGRGAERTSAWRAGGAADQAGRDAAGERRLARRLRPASPALRGNAGHQAAIAIGNALHLRRILELGASGRATCPTSAASCAPHRDPGLPGTLSTQALPRRHPAGGRRAAELPSAGPADDEIRVSRLEQGVAQRHLDWTPSLSDLARKVVPSCAPKRP
jgi:hypothetical protein